MARVFRVSVCTVHLLVTVALWLPSSTSAWFFGSTRTTTTPGVSSIPASCYRPSGSDCTWYTDCVERRIQCRGQPDDYAIAYADKYCRAFQQRASEFSSDGQRWINAVRKCLQVKLAPELRRTGLTCSYIKQKGFDSHVPCYLNPGGGAKSVCDLSLSDHFELVRTVGIAVLRELLDRGAGSAGAQVSAECLSRIIG